MADPHKYQKPIENYVNKLIKEQGLTSKNAVFNQVKLQGFQSCPTSQTTFNKHYGYLVDNHLSQLNATVADALFKKAVEDGDVNAQKFWLERRDPEFAKVEHNINTNVEVEDENLKRSALEELSRRLGLDVEDTNSET